MRLSLPRALLGALAFAQVAAAGNPAPVGTSATAPTRPNAAATPSAQVSAPAPRTASAPAAAVKPTAPADATTLLANVLTRSTRRDIILSRVQPNGSLRPYFDENAVLMLESAPYAELRVGDVVTFFHPQLNAVVVHRLVEKRDGMFWSRADRSAGAEAVHVTPENYRRRLVGVVYVNPQPAGNGSGTTSTPATYAAQPD